MLRAAAFVSSSVFLVACSSPPEVRSCNGEWVEACPPYTFAVLSSASFTPDAVPVADTRVRPRVQATFAACANAPSAVRVELEAIVSGGPVGLPDGGPSDAGAGTDAAIDGGMASGSDVRVYQLGSVRATAGATSIDTTIDNPFDLRIPRETPIRLRFTPVVGDCSGTPIEIDYRTGPLVEP